MTPSVWRGRLGDSFGLEHHAPDTLNRSARPGPIVGDVNRSMLRDYAGLGDCTYVTCCVKARGDDIAEMVENAVEVGYETIRKHCAGLKAWEIEHGYDPLGRGMSREKCVTLSGDWHVSFHRSRYRGRRCYFVKHSSIEYIWCEKALPHKRAA